MPSPLQEIYDPLLTEKEVRLFIKREDLIHPIVSGNKWRKLKYNLSKAKELGHSTILSFGGAFSNHIHALAAAAQSEDMRSIGIIRGEKILPLNSTLSDVESFGMKLDFVRREEYKRKTEIDFINELHKRYGDFYVIPEGGANTEGVRGCMEITEELNIPYDYVCLACGTGTTLAGVAAGIPKEKKVIGFPVLKGGDFLIKEVNVFLSEINSSEPKQWHLETDYHFGGYAKWNNALIDFINEFKNKHNIQLDQVYTGKMMWGLMDLIQKNFFEKGASIVTLHTGGVQGLYK